MKQLQLSDYNDHQRCQRALDFASASENLQHDALSVSVSDTAQ